jgi:hypothetical protein
MKHGAFYSLFNFHKREPIPSQGMRADGCAVVVHLLLNLSDYGLTSTFTGMLMIKSRPVCVSRASRVLRFLLFFRSIFYSFFKIRRLRDSPPCINRGQNDVTDIRR